MKKLLFITHTMNLSGAPRSLLNILKNIPRNKYDICLVSMYGGELRKEYENYVKELYVVTDKIDNNMFLRAVIRLLDFFRLIFLIKKIKPEIVLINSSANSRAILACRLLDKKTLVYVRESFEMLNDKYKYFRINFLKLANKLIAVSNTTCNFLQSIGIDQKKIKIIYNGIDHNEAYIRSRELPTKEYIEFINGYKIIGICGYMSSRKGIDFFISMLVNLSKNYNDLRFVIIGDFENKIYKKEAISFLEEKKLRNRLFITGIIDNVFPYLKYVDIYTMMSREEALPRVVLESAALAKPIVLFDTGGSKELLPSNYKYIVERFNLSVFESYVKELLNDESKRIQVGLHLQEFSKNFTLDRTINSLIPELD